jgi:hypothetical protein
MQIEIRCITYGCGNSFDELKFKSPANHLRSFYMNKPSGGLWSSPVDSKYGWRDWADSNNFGDLSTSFRFTFKGNIAVVDDYESLCKLPSLELPFINGVPIINFNRMIKLYDGIFVRGRGLHYLNAWDCETVLVFNRESILLEASAR